MVESYIENLKKQNSKKFNEILEIRNFVIKFLKESKVNFEENIKWNSFNYSINSNERITFNIPPKKYLRIIFHLGSKKVDTNIRSIFEMNNSFIIDYRHFNANWADNNRLVITFDNFDDFSNRKLNFSNIINFWVGL